jgi:hypothetical protein
LRSPARRKTAVTVERDPLRVAAWTPVSRITAMGVWTTKGGFKAGRIRE